MPDIASTTSAADEVPVDRAELDDPARADVDSIDGSLPWHTLHAADSPAVARAAKMDVLVGHALAVSTDVLRSPPNLNGHNFFLLTNAPHAIY